MFAFSLAVNERNEKGIGEQTRLVALIWKTSKKSRPYRKPDPRQCGERKQRVCAITRDSEIRPNARNLCAEGQSVFHADQRTMRH